MHYLANRPTASTIAFLVLTSTIWFSALPTSAMEEPAALAHEGYCLVSYFTDARAVKGDPKITAAHNGETFCFATEDAKKKFEADPAKYLPQLAGLCTTALGGPFGNRFIGDPTVFSVMDGKLYFFSSERAKASYDTKPSHYIEQAGQRFAKPAVGGHCMVSSRKEAKPVLGKAEHQAIYRGWVYHFANAEAKAEFVKSPAAYMTSYENHCAVGVSRGKRFPADGTRLRVHDGKAYLVFDADAEKQFDADPAGIIKKADEQWPTVLAELQAEQMKGRRTAAPKRP